MDNTNNNSFNSLGQTTAPTSGATANTTNPTAPTTPTKPATPDNVDNLSDEEVIDLFIRGIMEEKGVNPPTEEIRQSIFNDLRTQLLEQIDRSLVGELPDDKLNELSAIAMKNGEIDPNLIAQKINEANLDVAEITGVTMQRFREIYLNDSPKEQSLNSQTEA